MKALIAQATLAFAKDIEASTIQFWNVYPGLTPITEQLQLAKIALNNQTLLSVIQMDSPSILKNNAQEIRPNNKLETDQMRK